MTAAAEIMPEQKRPRATGIAGGMTHQEVTPVSRQNDTRRCEGCGAEFAVGGRGKPKRTQRFCGRSCAMKQTAAQRGPMPHLAEHNQRKRTKHTGRAGIVGKPCNCCKEWRPLAEFHKSSRAPDGLDHRCAPCNRKRALERYHKNAEAINATRRTPEFRARFNAYASQWAKEKRASDPTTSYKIKRLLRSRLWRVLKGARKDASMVELLGAPIDVVRRHLEAQFTDGMSWTNHGQPGWEIDHIVPCAVFDLTDPDQLRECFHYTNLQPLWGPENWRKGARR